MNREDWLKPLKKARVHTDCPANDDDDIRIEYVDVVQF
jgi:hypothetical protein